MSVSLTEKSEHPAEERFRTVVRKVCSECGSSNLTRADNETVCCNCGLVQESAPSRHLFAFSGGEHLGRGPNNASVFRHNLGTTSKKPHDKLGPEPHVLRAINMIHGQNGHLPTTVFAKQCPHELTKRKSKENVRKIVDGKSVYVCSAMNMIPNYGSTVQCPSCGGAVGHYVFRWLPGCDNPAIRVWADLRTLGAIDPADNHPLMQHAREIFKEVTEQKLSDEDAHRVAGPFIRGMKNMTKETDSEIKKILFALLESEKIKLE